MSCSLILSTGTCTIPPPIPSPNSPAWWLQCIPQTVGCHAPTLARKPQCKMCKDWPTSRNVTFCTECRWIGIGTCYYFFAVGSFFTFAYSLLSAWPYVPSLLLSLPPRQTNQLEMHLQNYICYLLQGQYFKPEESQTYHHRNCHSRKSSYFFNLPSICSKNKEQMTFGTCLSTLT